MKKENKYNYLYVLQGSYSYGFEDLTTSENKREIMNDLRDYRENEGGAYRIVKRRELNPKYKKPNVYTRHKKYNGGYERVYMSAVWLRAPGSMENCRNYRIF